MTQDNITADTTDCVTPINYSFGPLKIKTVFTFFTVLLQHIFKY